MKKILKLLIIFTLIITFTGCTVKDEGEMIISEDGSLQYEILLTYEKETLKTLLETENSNNTEISNEKIKNLIKNLEQNIHQDLKKEQYEDENFIGYKYTYNVDHIDKISSSKEEKINISSIQQNEKLSEKKLFTKKDDKGFTKYTSNMYYEIIQNDENYPKENTKLEYILTFKVTLPYESLSNNADEISNDGKTLTWYINSKKAQNINFTFSLTNINLIYNISVTLGITLILFIITFIISKKKKKAIKTMCYIVFILLSITSYIVVSKLNKTVIKLPELLVSNNNEIDYDSKDKIITLNFNEIDTTTNELTQMLNYSTEKNKIYTNVTEQLMKNDKNIKMYEKDNQLILETQLNKEKTNELFEINEDVTLKVLFENNLENKDIYDINYRINREKIIRENMVKTAIAQEGKTGETFWIWYQGYDTFIEWCAAFVSWVANEHGQIEAGNVPKFAWVKIGVEFYKEKGWFKYNKDYENPLPGDVIFFNWNNANDLIDHVALVEKYEDGYVYTIEGNVGGDSPSKAVARKVMRKKYKKDSVHIYGYGVPEY